VAVAALIGCGVAGRRLLGIALLALVALPGVGFLACFCVRADVPRLYGTEPQALGRDHADAVSWLRSQARAGDGVYCSSAVSLQYALFGGLPELQMDAATPNFGFPPEWLARRREILKTPPADPTADRNEGVRWVVVEDRTDFLPEPRLVEWQQQGKLVAVKRCGEVQVYEIRP